MGACAACGFEILGSVKYCPDCGAPQVTRALRLPDERKVVTVLFCDLVGFTAMSEAADPEDVDRMLTAYFTMARTAIEAFGGVVEKFIGDAVVGVFGVPATHEDDPERAVRAGLRICHEAEQLTSLGGGSLRLRVGINTGEMLVRLGVEPGSGEHFLAGDAINTASRLQSVAPPMGVGVGLATYEATADAFAYEALPPAAVKGKSDPVAVFHAIEPLGIGGANATRQSTTPFVGRERELHLLADMFDSTAAAHTVQLVTVVGEPGLGKSRLVAELAHQVAAKHERATWLQGRALAYGDGITFWALGEIVKGHAGILESDPSGVAAAKLDAVLPKGDDRDWFRQRLSPLVGLATTSSADRAELFTAWRRFLMHVARSGPTVVVFEDLHWADDAQLDFLEDCASLVGAAPLLLVGTARPEVYDRRPGYGAGLRNARRIDLEPLSARESRSLVASTLATTALPPGLDNLVLESSGGNPLFAGEIVRLLRERGQLTTTENGWALTSGEALALPGTVQALIAARLDTLDAATKSILADAAVIGRVFWDGALAGLGDRTLDDVDAALRALTGMDFVRPLPRSSVAGQTEYTFWHALTRDVAYEQLPRAARAARHVAAAQWVQNRAGERVEDVADVLAHHYSTALSLARATGDADQIKALEPQALRYLKLAGDRALELDTLAALATFQRALDLTPEGHAGRAQALTDYGEAVKRAGQHAKAVEALGQAAALLQEAGDPIPAARGLLRLAYALDYSSDPSPADLEFEALRLLEPLGPSAALVDALIARAGSELPRGRSREALAYLDRAHATAVSLDQPPHARLLAMRGWARSTWGDPGCLDDTRRALEIASSTGNAHDIANFHNNLAVLLWLYEGPQAGVDEVNAAITFARARGLNFWVMASTGGFLDAMIEAGDLEGAAESGARLLRDASPTNTPDTVSARAAATRRAALQGHVAAIRTDLTDLQTAAGTLGWVDNVVGAWASCASARRALGEDQQAADLLARVDGFPGIRSCVTYPSRVPEMVRTALGIGEPDLARRLVAGVEAVNPYAEHALVAANASLAESRGDRADAADVYADAARRWHDFGVVPEEGFALLGQGRCLLHLGRGADAVPALNAAHEVFDRLGAAPSLEETDQLLEAAQLRGT